MRTHIVKPAAPCLRSFEFSHYNEAREFTAKNAILGPSKPYRRIVGCGAPVWCVTVVNARAMKAGPQVITVQGTPGYLGLKLAGMRQCAPVDLKLEL